MPSTTIVTALDPKFLWGAYLLIASLRYHNVRVPVHVLAYNFSPEELKILTQFPGVNGFELKELTWRYFNCLKPAAILTANTEYITWMDADCIVTGDVTPYLSTENESFGLRFRTMEEHIELYRSLFPNLYNGDKPPGALPPVILDQWRQDVGEEQSCRIETTCSACCFSLHRRHLGFVKRWEEQMARVLPSITDGQVYRKVVDWKNKAYRLTDEAVLNSLLAFSTEAPNISEYQLDKDPNAQLVHFATSPKPWEIWLPRYHRYFPLVMDMIDWCEKQGYNRPPLPLALKRSWKKYSLCVGKAYQILSDLKHRFV